MRTPDQASGVLPIHDATVRLFLHVLAATVCVGGAAHAGRPRPGRAQLVAVTGVGAAAHRAATSKVVPVVGGAAAALGALGALFLGVLLRT
jgi:hypothetical protein